MASNLLRRNLKKFISFKFSKSYIAALSILSLPVMNAWSDMASPHAIHEAQPDGTEIILFIRGNSSFNWQEDINGHTVIRGKDKRYTYAQRGASGRLESSKHEVGKANPRALGLQKRILPSATVRAQLKANGPAGQTAEEAATGQPQATSGSTLKNLVVLIRFADHNSRPLPSQADIDTLMNAVGGDPALAPAGSLRDIYLNNSYGALTIDSTVVAWATVSQDEAYYANSNSGLTSKTWEALTEALDIVDTTVNFDDFDQDNDGYIDAITFLHSGYGAEWGGTAGGAHYTDRIWSHKWGISGTWQSQEGVRVYNYHISPGIWGTSGSDIGRIGVIAHETGHFLGLPDLYDSDTSPGSGIGSFGLMANSWGSDGSQEPPPLMSAWSKIQLGWISPALLSAPGNYPIDDSLSSSLVYKVVDNYPADEYLLIENRKRYDNQGQVADNVPTGDGMVIFHIDDTAEYNTEGYPGQGGWPANGNHYRVAVLQADGDYDLERGNNRGDSGDAYRASGVDAIGPATTPSTDAYQFNNSGPTGHEITSISAAGASMFFDFNIDDLPGTPPADPDGLTATETGHTSIELSWADNANDEDNYEVERSPDGSTNWSVITTLGANANNYSDTELATGTTYFYQVRASNAAGNSGYSNLASATTTTPVAPTQPGNVTATAAGQSQVNLTWTDAENESWYEVQRRTDAVAYATIATLGAGTTSYSDTGLTDDTTYYYTVVAGNDYYQTPSNEVSATTEPVPAQAYAFAESTAQGSSSGNLDATMAEGGSTEQITEAVIGRGKNARSGLEHTWQVGPVNGGAQVTLHFTGSESSSDDDFEIHYSIDGGASYTYALTIDGSSQSVTLDPAASGTVLVRLTDTDNSKGNSTADVVHVDYLMIDSAGEIAFSGPGSLGGTPASSSTINLTWADATGETSYLVNYRLNGTSTWQTPVTGLPANTSNYTLTGLAPNTSYDAQVCASNDTESACTETASPITTFADGGGAPVINSATGYKIKGVQHVELTWTAQGDVYILRDGNIVYTGPGSSYDDNIGNKGGGSYAYEICNTGTNTCSATTTVTF